MDSDPLSSEPASMQPRSSRPSKARPQNEHEDKPAVEPCASSTHRKPQWTAPSREQATKEYSQAYTEQEKAEAWQRTAKIVKVYSDERIERWIAEMDNLLVFSGLFSAVVTTLVAQTYPLLQPAQPDQTAAILKQISLQFSSFSMTQSSLNSTQPAFTGNPVEEAAIPTAPSSTVTLNTLWFASLILSLSASLASILVKQWLSKYRSGLSGTSRDIARLRQYRLNNLSKWRVDAIVWALPVVLQASLVLFFVGLLILLTDLHPTVAKVATALIAFTFIVMGGTFLLPVLWSDCCYLSSPAFFTATLVHNSLYAGKHVLDSIMRPFAYDPSRGASRFRQTLGKLHDYYIRHFDSEIYRGFMIWSLRERDIVRSTAANLDADMLFTAYSYTSDLCYLSETAATNLITLPPAVAIRCFRRLALRIHMDFGSLRGGLLRIDSQMPYAAAQSYRFWIAAMYQAMYLPEALSRPIKFLCATFNHPPGTTRGTSDPARENPVGVGPEAIASMAPIPWAVGRHMTTAIELLLHRQRTHTGPAQLTLILGQRLFNTLALLLRCCITSFVSPDATKAHGKEEEILACVRSTITQLTSSLALQRSWSSDMVSCVASILEDFHQSPFSGLLTDDLLAAAESTARGAQPSVNSTEFSEARRGLEDVVEEIRGKLGHSGAALTMALDYKDDQSDEVWYVEAGRYVFEKHLGGLMIMREELY